MTKTEALYQFWSSFGIPAYNESSVPTGKDKPDFPYITYQVVTDSFNDNAFMSASLWYRNTTWKPAHAKSAEISQNISRGGKIISYDDGAVWIKRGQPFSQDMGDETDNMIKRIVINIIAEYISQD